MLKQDMLINGLNVILSFILEVAFSIQFISVEPLAVKK